MSAPRHHDVEQGLLVNDHGVHSYAYADEASWDKHEKKGSCSPWTFVLLGASGALVVGGVVAGVCVSVAGSSSNSSNSPSSGETLSITDAPQRTADAAAHSESPPPSGTSASGGKPTPVVPKPAVAQSELTLTSAPDRGSEMGQRFPMWSIFGMRREEDAQKGSFEEFTATFLFEKNSETPFDFYDARYHSNFISDGNHGSSDGEQKEAFLKVVSQPTLHRVTVHPHHEFLFESDGERGRVYHSNLRDGLTWTHWLFGEHPSARLTPQGTQNIEKARALHLSDEGVSVQDFVEFIFQLKSLFELADKEVRSLWKEIKNSYADQETHRKEMSLAIWSAFGYFDNERNAWENSDDVRSWLPDATDKEPSFSGQGTLREYMSRLHTLSNDFLGTDAFWKVDWLSSTMHIIHETPEKEVPFNFRVVREGDQHPFENLNGTLKLRVDVRARQEL